MLNHFFVAVISLSAVCVADGPLNWTSIGQVKDPQIQFPNLEIPAGKKSVLLEKESDRRWRKPNPYYGSQHPDAIQEMHHLHARHICTVYAKEKKEYARVLKSPVKFRQARCSEIHDPKDLADFLVRAYPNRNAITLTRDSAALEGTDTQCVFESLGGPVDKMVCDFFTVHTPDYTIDESENYTIGDITAWGEPAMKSLELYFDMKITPDKDSYVRHDGDSKLRGADHL